jgi:hypothetical protein
MVSVLWSRTSKEVGNDLLGSVLPLIERKLRASYRSRETRTIEAELVARRSIEGVL